MTQEKVQAPNTFLATFLFRVYFPLLTLTIIFSWNLVLPSEWSIILPGDTFSGPVYLGMMAIVHIFQALNSARHYQASIHLISQQPMKYCCSAHFLDEEQNRSALVIIGPTWALTGPAQLLYH